MKKVLTIMIATLFVLSFGLFAFAEEDFTPVDDSSSSSASIGDFASLFETFSSDSGSDFDLSGLLSGGGGIMDMLGGLTGESSGDISAVLGSMLGGVEGGALLDTLSQSFGSLGLGVTELLGGGLELGGMDDLYTGLLGGLDSMGIDSSALTSMLGESGVFNFFAGLYTAGAVTPTPETTTEVETEAAPTSPPVQPTGKENPNTGSSTTGIAAFAVLSAAAAVAFVARKKKED